MNGSATQTFRHLEQRTAGERRAFDMNWKRFRKEWKIELTKKGLDYFT
jgi:hypothetical protein